MEHDKQAATLYMGLASAYADPTDSQGRILAHKNIIEFLAHPDREEMQARWASYLAVSGGLGGAFLQIASMTSGLSIGEVLEQAVKVSDSQL